MGTPMTYISGNTGTYQSGTFNKGTIALNLNPSSLASGNNWYNGVDVTATQYLIYSDTYSQGQATQANSKPTAWTTPDLSDTSLLNLINTLPDRVGVLPFTSLPLALQWLNATNKYFLIKTNYENIVTSGLVLNLDAGWYNSYSGTTTWFDIKGGYNNTLINSPTYSSTNQGAILFDGIDNYCKGDILASTFSSDFSIGAWFYHTSYQQWEAIFSNNASSTSWSGNDKDAAILGFRGWDNTGGNFDITKKTIGINGVGSTPDGVFLDLGDHLNQWIYVCLTRSGTNIEITAFKQGQILYTAGTYSYTIQTRNAYLIGRHWYNNGNNGQNFGGYIPIVQVYNKKLSDSEILQNYNAQRYRFGLYDIVQSGNTLNLDASNYLSYPRSGTTWFDMTSNSNNGTLTNGPTFSSDNSGSIVFDGTDDYGIIPYNSVWNYNNNITLEAWVMVTSNTSGYQGIFGPFSLSPAYNGFNFSVESGTNKLAFLVGGSGGSSYYVKQNTTYTLNTWYHLVGTINNGTSRLYVNGILQTDSTNMSVSSAIGPFMMGKFYDGVNAYYFGGRIANGRFYNRVLSQQEITQNYESYRRIIGSTGYTTSGLTLNLDAGNYASYPTTGTKWVDISGDYNNGIITNGVVWSSASGGTFTFDGVDDYVNIGVNKSCNRFTGDFAVCAWVNRSNLGGTWGNIIGDYYTNSTANALEWQLMVNNSNNLFVYNVTNGYVFSSTATGIAINTWMYVTLTRIGSTLKLYANTTEVASTTNTTTFGSATGNLNIGIDGNNAAEPFTGKISNVMIYKNKGLTASEILQNYNALKGRFGL